ncbi:putative quinol monooxygenase [Acidocella aromatica]|uniref:Quinol monooxygenase YgiN n=1 Tax=Acidocella aromatica TaxID=1303579 RepID=A0A840VRN7_9PROT|nr:putative quinol monooxygenase [Acidocella aromatica]MBB5372932.1 quinol monooxygenase YgiN [Acidocella aromatica]
MSSTAISVFATLTAAPGKTDALRAVLTALVAPSRAEPGTLQYTLHEALETPGVFHVYETYKDQAAVDAHMASPHLQKALSEAGPLLGAAPSITTAKQIA